ncbi:hypothetical protein PPYR_08144 [Photinus pyralis]|uniref:rRNA-processing protein UTP23 homolog n=1 Tax=Photinus pyralis TaxID=7054 RepID=A0A1Y1N120_PHOPY|nr:rRNA-processing protein UTP23 homolog [Photinus pyralis]KAB0797150.1 hypothetical protein PPYR_08144 [Photinus pyralis]
MKIKRYKKMSKNVSFYVNHFKFHQPYQILMDGTFCYAALNSKINIQDNLPRYLQSELKFRTTSCAIIETENLGKQVAGALVILKNFLVHKCGHEGKPIPGADCIYSMVKEKNQNHYFVATQDLALQSKIRKLPAVPLLYFVRKTPVLDQPSEASKKEAHDMLGLTPNERETISSLKQQHGITQEPEQSRKRKRKGGPNPLSCKKKKKKPEIQAGKIKKPDPTQKKRKKIKVPKHVKDLLKNVQNKN